MSKITKWSKENKLHFNDQKSKVMLISRRRKERKGIDIYLYNNHVEQVKYTHSCFVLCDTWYSTSKTLWTCHNKSVNAAHSHAYFLDCTYTSYYTQLYFSSVLFKLKSGEKESKELVKL
jgi:hypothetical protein